MSRQAWIIDIHEYYRTGGIDWPLAADVLDAVGIRACIGMRQDKLYLEHIEKAEKFGLDWFSWGVPNPRINLEEQADFYFELPGVKDHRVCGDIEPVEGQMVNEYQARKFFERLDLRAGESAWYYSNHYYTSKLGFPQWIKPRFKWWAEYPFDIVTVYKTFERYLEKNSWTIPKWAVKDGYTPELHQFTNKGNAPLYIANLYTDDPDWPNGIKSADLTVSLIDSDEFKLILNPGEAESTIEERVSNLETRMDQVEAWILKHEGASFITLKAKESFPLGIVVGHDQACEGENPPGKPIIEHPPINERIIIEAGAEILAIAKIKYSCKDNAETPEIFASGMIPYYVAVEGYPGKFSFIRADLVEIV